MTAICAACHGRFPECRICAGRGTIPTIAHACAGNHHDRCKGFIAGCDCFCHTAIPTTAKEAT